MPTDTMALSRRIVEAVDPGGKRWPKWHRNDASDGSLMLCTNAPDLSLPQNLHYAYDVADAADLLRDGTPTVVHWVEDHFEVPYWIPGDEDYAWATGATSNLALMDAVAKAKGVKR